MAKNLRFTELVKKSGAPETLTLWTKPESNTVLQKAIRQNRVLTIINNPHKKDFGLIGFEQHHSALYLIFPKALPKAQAEAQVIGINFDLLKESKSATGPNKLFASTTKRKPKPTREPKSEIVPVKKIETPKPQRKKFVVTVSRTAAYEISISVNAFNLADAEAQGLEKVKRTKFSTREIKDEVKSIAKAK